MNRCEVLTTAKLMQDAKGFFEKPRYIFVDDAQFICAKHEDGEWFKHLYNSWKSKEGDKMFWVFYGEHQYQGEKNQKFVFQEEIDKVKELKKIIRNSKQIAKYACGLSDDAKYKEAVEERGLGHNFDGEDVDTYFVRLDTESDHEYAIGQCLKNLKRDGWNFGDIAILFSKDNDIPSALLDCTRFFRTGNPMYTLPEVGKVKVGSASKNHDDGYLVVDTIRRYSSLDRPVVIGINPNVSKSDQYTNPDGLELILATRAIAKLIIIRKDQTVDKRKKNLVCTCIGIALFVMAIFMLQQILSNLKV